MKWIFEAYNWCGKLQLSTLANAPITYELERKIYQDRLNRGDFIRVEITSDDLKEPPMTLYPQKVTE